MLPPSLELRTLADRGMIGMDVTGLDFTDVALRDIGAFYTFAGVVATRGGLMSRLLDNAIAAIGGDKPNAAETVRALWMVSAGIIILAGGVALDAAHRTGRMALRSVGSAARALSVGRRAPLS